jgi:hypothetical protein
MTLVAESSSVTKCPIVGCLTQMIEVPYRKTRLPYCVEHGLRLHRGTFVYFNGHAKEDKRRARLRNFVFEPSYVARHVLDSPAKAETWRLGAEMSEDALSWNVFAALLKAGKLADVARHLTGRMIEGEPELYMWGCRVKLGAQEAPAFAPLCQLRNALEHDIGRFKTEPDILLVVPGQLVICVEAKFASGNTLAAEVLSAVGEKPNHVKGLIDRYLGPEGKWSGESRHVVRAQIGGRLHSQLFRNIVFAARMAEVQGGDWHVVNLISSTQWAKRRSVRSDFKDPTADVQSYLTAASRDHFTFRTWEGIYSELVKDGPNFDRLRDYLLSKSAHYHAAFALA